MPNGSEPQDLQRLAQEVVNSFPVQQPKPPFEAAQKSVAQTGQDWLISEAQEIVDLFPEVPKPEPKKPLVLPDKPSLAKKAIDYAVEGIKGVPGQIAGYGEAAIGLASGVPSWLLSRAAIPAKYVYDIFAKGIQKADLEEAREFADKVAALGTYEPTTELGKGLTEVAVSPFSAIYEGVNKAGEAMGMTPDQLSGVNTAVDIVLISSPHFKRLGKQFLDYKFSRKEAIPMSEFKEAARAEPDIPPEVKQAVESAPDTTIPKEIISEIEPKIPREEPAPKVEAAPETEIRVSQDKATGETVIRIPQTQARPTVEVPPAPPIETPAETPIKAAEPKPEPPGARSLRMQKKLAEKAKVEPRGVDLYLNEQINYGGEAMPRGAVIADLQKKGFKQKEIDAYMMGAETIKPEIEKPLIPKEIEPPVPIESKPAHLQDAFIEKVIHELWDSPAKRSQFMGQATQIFMEKFDPAKAEGTNLYDKAMRFMRSQKPLIEKGLVRPEQTGAFAHRLNRQEIAGLARQMRREGKSKKEIHKQIKAYLGGKKFIEKPEQLEQVGVEGAEGRIRFEPTKEQVPGAEREPTAEEIYERKITEKPKLEVPEVEPAREAEVRSILSKALNNDQRLVNIVSDRVLNEMSFKEIAKKHGVDDAKKIENEINYRLKRLSDNKELFTALKEAKEKRKTDKKAIIAEKENIEKRVEEQVKRPEKPDEPKVLEDEKTAKTWAKAKMTEDGGELGFAELMDLPRPLKVGLSKGRTFFDRAYKRWVIEQVKMPFWDDRLEPIVSKLLGTERESQRVSEKARNLMDKYFKKEDHALQNKIIEFEIENDASIRKRTVGGKPAFLSLFLDHFKPKLDDPAAFDKLARRDLSVKHPALLSEAEIRKSLSKNDAEVFMKFRDEYQAHDAYRSGFDFIQKKYLKMKLTELYKQDGLDDVLARAKAQKFIDEHYIEGYSPLFRHGEWAVALTKPWKNKKGEHRAELWSFEILEDAEKFADTARNEIQQNMPDITPEALDKYIRVFNFKDSPRDLSPFVMLMKSFPVIENLMKSRGIDNPALAQFRQMLGDTIYEAFAKGRLKQRRKVPGWSKNYLKAAEDYITGVPFSYAKRFNRPSIEGIFKELPKDLQQYGRDLISFWLGEKQWEGKNIRNVRRGIYDFFLAAKPSFALVNSSQKIMTSFPNLVREVGFMKANKIFAKSTVQLFRLYGDFIEAFEHRFTEKKGLTGRDIIKNVIKNASYLSLEEKRSLQRLQESGELRPVRLLEMRGGHGKTNALEVFGSISEYDNRIHAALIGAKIGETKGEGLPETYKTAERFLGETQFVYSKATRQKMARGVGSTVFALKSYVFNWLNFMGKLFKEDKAAFSIAALNFVAMAGVMGIPGFNVLKNMVGKYLSSKKVISDSQYQIMTKEIEDKLQKTKLGQVVAYGLPALVNIQGDWAFGMPELFGLAPESIYKSAKGLVSGIGKPGYLSWERIIRSLPTELKHIARFIQLEMGNKLPTDVYGKPRITEQDLKMMTKEHRGYLEKQFKELPVPQDVPLHEKILYLIGFPTTTVSEFQKESYAIKEMGRDIKSEKIDIHREIARHIASLQNENIRRVILTIKPSEWNERIPAYLKHLPSKRIEAIDDLRERLRRGGFEFSPSSILYHLKEYWSSQ